MNAMDLKVAVFWCSLLHQIIFGEVDKGDVYQHLKDIASQEFLFPNGQRKKPSLSTLKRKLKQYREGGLEALARKKRNDIGKPRSFSQEIIDKAVDIKKDQPKRSHSNINFILNSIHKVQIPKSTLYRHLKENDATRLKLGVISKKVRCRWTRDIPNELWVGDFSHGPYVLVDGETYPSYLSLFIDCNSRYVVEGRYYLRQSLDVLVDSLLRAWTVHGVSEDLYLDNAKVYHSDALKAACYDMDINLIHRPNRDPSPGGLVERLFGTNQAQFESEVRAGDILKLDHLNKAFQAWLHLVYHETVHSETNEKPRTMFQAAMSNMKPINMERVIKFFMSTEERTVNPDFSDVSINKKLFKVDPKYRGDRVLVKYDPFSELDKVFIYTLKEVFLETAPLYNRERGAHKEQEPETVKKPKYNYIDILIDTHDEQLMKQAKGIDYKKLLQQQRWPFPSFIETLACLMGKKGGLNAFTAGELETLKKVYDKYDTLNEPRLKQAFEAAEVKNIAHVAHQLKQIYRKGEK